MLVNILLFQHYSCQICNVLFSILYQHNRLRPNDQSIYAKWFSVNASIKGDCSIRVFECYIYLTIFSLSLKTRNSKGGSHAMISVPILTPSQVSASVHVSKNLRGFLKPLETPSLVPVTDLVM